MFTLQAISFARKMTVIAIAILACLVLSAPAQASPIALTPGSGSVAVDASDIFSICCGTLITSAQTVMSADGGQLTFTLNSAVYSDPDNIACPGCLDFIYQVTNSSETESITRLEAVDYQGWTTDVGYLTSGGSLGDPFADGDAAPVSFDRSAAGDIIGFGFFSDASVLPPGSTSKVLVIQTNATNFTAAGIVNVYGSNGAESIVDPFQPALTSPVPEPASVALLGIGLLAGIGVLRFVRVRRGRQSV